MILNCFCDHRREPDETKKEVSKDDETINCKHTHTPVAIINNFDDLQLDQKP